MLDSFIFIGACLVAYYLFFSFKLPKGEKKSPRTVNPALKTKQTSVKKVRPLIQPQNPAQVLQQHDKTFSEKTFIDGARAAFNMLYQACAEKDLDTLENLVSPALFDEIYESIEEGRTNKALEASKVELVDARVKGKTMVAEVKYSVRKENTEEERTEIWTWTRPINHNDPNWTLESIVPVS